MKMHLFLNYAPRHGDWLGSGGIAPCIPNLGNVLGEWSASRPDGFTTRERAPGTHWIGGWVDPPAVLDAVVKRKIPSPRRKSNTRTPIVSLPMSRTGLKFLRISRFPRACYISHTFHSSWQYYVMRVNKYKTICRLITTLSCVYGLRDWKILNIILGWVLQWVFNTHLLGIIQSVLNSVQIINENIGNSFTIQPFFFWNGVYFSRSCLVKLKIMSQIIRVGLP